MGTKVKKHGLRASHTADVCLDDCRIPGANILGGKEKFDGEGRARPRGRQVALAGCDGDVRGLAPDRRRAGARHRPRRLRVSARLREGARPVRHAVIENQAITFTLADMKMEIDAARLLVWRASWMGRNQKPFTQRPRAR